jgi:hypothetical protein
MKILKSFTIIFLPFSLVLILSITALQIAVLDKSANLAAKILERQTVVSSLNERIIHLSDKANNPIAFFKTWQATSIGDASLMLQSVISKLATEYNIPQQLLGPDYDNRDQPVSLFSIEFESETTLAKVVALMEEIDKIDPWVSIAELDMRPINSFEVEISETQVYFRVILQGFYNAQLE